jgi:hypothetical protein
MIISNISNCKGFNGDACAGFLGDHMIIDTPKDVTWPSTVKMDFFLDIYDWDRLVLDSNSENLLSVRLELCSGPLPCIFTLLGTGLQSSILRREGKGSLACLSKAGCSALHIANVQLVCTRLDKSPAGMAPLEIRGAFLQMENSSTFDCQAETDGGSIRAYEGALIQVKYILLAQRISGD